MPRGVYDRSKAAPWGSRPESLRRGERQKRKARASVPRTVVVLPPGLPTPPPVAPPPPPPPRAQKAPKVEKITVLTKGELWEGYMESLLDVHDWCESNSCEFLVVMTDLLERFLKNPRKPGDE